MVATAHDELKPEDFLHFIETHEFVRQWESLGFDCEQDLWKLQIAIMRNPEAGAVIAGTGGLRKLRFGRAGVRIGKRGGVRVCYVHFIEVCAAIERGRPTEARFWRANARSQAQ